MTTEIQHLHQDRPESTAQSLMLWMGVATVAVTVIFAAAVTLLRPQAA